jgi:hypothetical protein
MREWIKTITDRNQDDIINKTPKAYLHASDLNRIKNNVAHLSEWLRSQGFAAPPIQPVNWNMNDVPNIADIRHICDSILAITQAFDTPNDYADLSAIPNKALTYTDVNNIERNLSGIKVLIEQMLSYHFLAQFTYRQISAYTYGQLRKGLVSFPRN